MDLRPGGNNVAQQRLRTLHVDGEIVVNKEDCDLPFFLARARLQQEQLVHHALVGAKAVRVSEKSWHRAELASIRAPASRLDRNNPKCPPAFSELVQHCGEDMRH